jgi:hypothetical protein
VFSRAGRRAVGQPVRDILRIFFRGKMVGRCGHFEQLPVTFTVVFGETGWPVVFRFGPTGEGILF